jgi:hypothetical protein
MVMRPETIEFYNELIEVITKVPKALRFDIIDSFAKKHRMSYDTVKTKIFALSYALQSREASIPKSMKSDIWNIREAIQKGAIKSASAKEATAIFLSKTPITDIERLNREFPIDDPAVRKIQEQLAKQVDMTRKKMIGLGLDPVRAYSQTWRIIGNKIHHEIPEVIRQAPKEKVEDVIKSLWEENLYSAQARHNYITADLIYLAELKKIKRNQKLPYPYNPVDLGQIMAKRGVPMTPEAIGQRIESDIKNLDRYVRPGKERGMPRDLKGTFKGMASEFPPNMPKRIQPRLTKLSRRVGDTLFVADELWSEKNKIRENKILPYVNLRRRKR